MNTELCPQLHGVKTKQLHSETKQLRVNRLIRAGRVHLTETIVL